LGRISIEIFVKRHLSSWYETSLRQ
jgi:hypothetical protein